MRTKKNNLDRLREQMEAAQVADVELGHDDGTEFMESADFDDIAWFPLFMREVEAGRCDNSIRDHLLADPRMSWTCEWEQEYCAMHRPTDWHFYWIGFASAVVEVWEQLQEPLAA